MTPLADAMNRLVAHRIALEGESMRRHQPSIEDAPVTKPGPPASA